MEIEVVPLDTAGKDFGVKREPISDDHMISTVHEGIIPYSS